MRSQLQANKELLIKSTSIFLIYKLTFLFILYKKRTNLGKSYKKVLISKIEMRFLNNKLLR